MVCKRQPPAVSVRPTRIQLRVQKRDPAIASDLAWEDDNDSAKITAQKDGPVAADPDLAMWAGSVHFVNKPIAGEFRLVIEEHEFVSANYTGVANGIVEQPGRLIYAEIFMIDETLIN